MYSGIDLVHLDAHRWKQQRRIEQAEGVDAVERGELEVPAVDQARRAKAQAGLRVVEVVLRQDALEQDRGLEAGDVLDLAQHVLRQDRPAVVRLRQAVRREQGDDHELEVPLLRMDQKRDRGHADFVQRRHVEKVGGVDVVGRPVGRRRAPGQDLFADRELEVVAVVGQLELLESARRALELVLAELELVGGLVRRVVLEQRHGNQLQLLAELGGDIDLELALTEVVAVLARAVRVVAHVARGELARDRAPLDFAAGPADRRECHQQSHETHTDATHTDPHAFAPSC